MSINPGATINPETSMTSSTPAGSIEGSILEILLPSTSRSDLNQGLPVPSNILPFFKSMEIFESSFPFIINFSYFSGILM
jgi:hypothetical protein